jgi:hypothetical protein
MNQALSQDPAQTLSDHSIINLLCLAFIDNSRMRMLIGKVGGFSSRLETVVTYCFYLAKKLGGIISSTCRNTHIIYYQKSEMYHSLGDYMRYCLVAIFAVRLDRVWGVFKREKRVKTIRNREIARMRDSDYLYVWYLAQRKNYHKLDGLVEVKNQLISESLRLKLPIYMETTEQRLLPMYERIGFKFYTSSQITKSGMVLWFGRFDPNQVDLS